MPSATLAALAAFEGSGIRGGIIGTTGFDAAGEQAVANAAKRFAMALSSVTASVSGSGSWSGKSGNCGARTRRHKERSAA